MHSTPTTSDSSLVRSLSEPSSRRSSCTVSDNEDHQHSEITSCLDSYKMFKRCSDNSSGTQQNCGMAVKRYMQCALNGC